MRVPVHTVRGRVECVCVWGCMCCVCGGGGRDVGESVSICKCRVGLKYECSVERGTCSVHCTL